MSPGECTVATVPDVDRNCQEVELHDRYLWWVVDGALRVQVRDGAGRHRIRLGAGDAVVVDAGARVTVSREPGTTALGCPAAGTPVVEPTEQVGRSATRGRVARSQHGTLVELFAEGLHYLRTRGPVDGEDAGTFTGADAVPDATVRRPPLPTRTAARAAARLIMERPADDLDIPHLADAVFSSPSTLHRQFVTDTGLTPGQWRTRLRLALAVADLRNSSATLEQVAQRVGLSSASALCRLFRTRTGTSPESWRAGHDHGDGHRNLPGPAGGGETRSTWPRTNRFHVLVWAWRGGCRVTVGDSTRRLAEGGLVWLPAGVPNAVTGEPGGLILPVGARPGRQPGPDRPVTVPADHAPTAQVLLATAGREYDPVAPEQTTTLDELFYAYLAGDAGDPGRTTADTAPVDRRRGSSRLLNRLAVDFRREPGVTRTAAQWAEILDCTGDDLAAALELFGARDIRQWTARARMVMARRLLASGIPVGVVARHLGYSGTASFSHVFRRTHGVAPGGYDGYV
jgi:AraC-like DNA-binding protein